jgi:hypothetical protein
MTAFSFCIGYYIKIQVAGSAMQKDSQSKA